MTPASSRGTNVAGDRLTGPGVGVGVLVFRNRCILLGRRESGHGSATWNPPGGHLEWGESIEDCARREVFEETGVEICDLRRAPYTNDFFDEEGAHYVSLFVVARHSHGEAVRKEPSKTSSWKWFPWQSTPEPLFLPFANLRASGYDPFRGRAF